jgi:hypothetical protein
MRRLLEDIDIHGPVGWADKAADLGWSDQAHLIRDFNRHTGVTPSQYLAAQRSTYDRTEAATAARASCPRRRERQHEARRPGPLSGDPRSPQCPTKAVAHNRPSCFHMAWSRWRRRHQARARTSHYRTRGDTDQEAANTSPRL